MAWMEVRYAGSCRCGARVEAGARANWTRGERQLQGCPACGGEGTAAQAQPAQAQPAQAQPAAQRQDRARQVQVVEADSVGAAMRALAAHVARLDPYQREVGALRPTNGNARVLATAGSGKTTALVGMLGSAVAEGEAPGGIVAVTFTRKGGDEIRQRLARVVPPGTLARFRHVGTYDAMAVRALMQHDRDHNWAMDRCVNISKAGSPVPSATMLWDAILTGRKDGVPGLDGTPGLDLPNPEVGAYMLAVDVARAVPESDEAIDARVRTAEADLGLARLSEAWDTYKAAKRALQAWDFLDARHAFYRALAAGEIPGARWVVVDEAQDNSPLDLACAVTLATRGGGSVVLIGDVRQAIFEWRGGDPEILATADTVLKACTLVLARNYRSGRQIVDAGNRVAEGQSWSVGPAATPARDVDGAVVVASYEDPMAAADAAAEAIQAAGGDLTRHAVLCRTNAAAGLYEAAFLQAGVPCVVVGGSAFFTRREVKDALAYLTLSEKDDPGALAQVVKVPRTFLGGAFLDLVATCRGDLPTRMESAARGARRSGPENARLLAAFLRGLRAPGLSLATRAERVATRLATGAHDVGGDTEGKGILALALAQIARRFDGVEALRAFAARCVADTVTVGEEAEAPAGRVTISTIHKAKGREWEHVVLDATEGAFPHSRSAESPRRMAEERRLFYAAVTRAKDRLDLTWCDVGLNRRTQGGPSPFLRLAAPEAFPEGGPDGGGAEAPEALAGLLGDGNGGENPDAPAVVDRAVHALIMGEDALATAEAQALADARAFLDPHVIMDAGMEPMDAGVEQPTPLLTDSEEPAGGAGWDIQTWAAAVAVAEAGTAAEPAARPGAGGRYVEITVGDFAALLCPLGFTARDEAGQVVFAAGGPRTHGMPAIKVYTSIPADGEAVREVGEDSIKVAALWHQNGDPKPFPMHQRLPYATRTRGWRLAVLARVAEVSRLFNAGPPCSRCEAPTVKRRRHDGSGTFSGCVRYSLCSR